MTCNGCMALQGFVAWWSHPAAFSSSAFLANELTAMIGIPLIAGSAPIHLHR
jgi:hypothetical protein